MSRPDWVDPYAAIPTLATLWDIPSAIAEGIIWNAMYTGEVPVRGVPVGTSVPRIISKEIGASMLPGSFSVLEFRNVEIEWAGLLEAGGKLIPSNYTIRRETRTRPLNKTTASKFAATYIAQEAEAGRHPTMSGLEEAASAANMRGGRPHLREAYHRLLGAKVRVGRPTSKSAKK